MKRGLILEGGAMRGMFTAGVLDVLMENDIEFDGVIGVSAGATFGCNYITKQIGRTIRYNKKYCRDKRYCSFRSLIKTGDLFGEDFCYNKIPNELDPFDNDAFRKSDVEFYIVTTDIETGEAVYKKYDVDDPECLLWMRASASMPLASRIVEADGRKMLDGGMADSIPVKAFEDMGYNKNVVVLTQPEAYKKEKNKVLPIIRLKYKKFPKLIEVMEKRHIMYNETKAYIKEKEARGELFVIRPEEKLDVGHIEHNADKLEKTYQAGRKVAEKNLDKLKEYLKPQ
ncbi:MAG: patatin family protein [Clostridia bacterium]|nr:patatin family protein [Clostridia bacterium]